MTAPLTTKAFVVVTDDLCQNSSLALLLASKAIAIVLQDVLPLFCYMTCISNGPPVHFKNWFQHMKWAETCYVLSWWLFTISERKKNTYDGVRGSLDQVACLYNLQSEPVSCIRWDTSVLLTYKKSLTKKLVYLPLHKVNQFRNENNKKWQAVQPENTIVTCMVQVGHLLGKVFTKESADQMVQ